MERVVMKQKETKVIVFDMDGTIADLYGVEDWQNQLETHNPMPYLQAKPLVDMDTLACILGLLKTKGYRVVVTSWLAMNSTPMYDEQVRLFKRMWLEQYDFPYDEIHLVKYGTTKANCTRHLGGNQILVDDNEKVLNGWHLGNTINAQEDIIKELTDLLVAEIVGM